MTAESSLHQLVANGVRDLRPYQPGKPVEELERELGISEIIKLASNENPRGASPRVENTLRDCANDLARYPDGSGFRLKTQLSAQLNVLPSQLTLGSHLLILRLTHRPQMHVQKSQRPGVTPQSIA